MAKCIEKQPAKTASNSNRGCPCLCYDTDRTYPICVASAKVAKVKAANCNQTL